LIWRPFPLFRSAAATSFSPSFFVTSQAGIVSGNVVEAIVPSRDTRIGVGAATWSTFRASAKKAFKRARTAGLEAPRASFQTT
jgi:hypothetical protein